MKRVVISAFLLMLCLAFPSSLLAGRHSVKEYKDKETTADMRNMNRIFIGWVDLGADDWGAHGYTTKTDWTNVIESLNSSFNSNLLATYLPGKTLVAAKNKDDVNAAGCDLYIKFSDVHVDYDNYHLILAIHFIDPKTNTEIGSIPIRPYYGNDWGLRGYLNEALKGVGKKLQVEVTGVQGKKK
ncbi:MAG: hypothetical protein ACLQLH_14665 [Terracidiphilus sp.]